MYCSVHTMRTETEADCYGTSGTVGLESVSATQTGLAVRHIRASAPRPRPRHQVFASFLAQMPSLEQTCRTSRPRRDGYQMILEDSWVERMAMRDSTFLITTSLGSRDNLPPACRSIPRS